MGHTFPRSCLQAAHPLLSKIAALKDTWAKIPHRPRSLQIWLWLHEHCMCNARAWFSEGQHFAAPALRTPDKSSNVVGP